MKAIYDAATDTLTVIFKDAPVAERDEDFAPLSRNWKDETLTWQPLPKTSTASTKS